MATQRTRPTPHFMKVDLSDFKGVIVLGEPLELLASALLRMRARYAGDDRVEVDFTLPRREGDAFMRALARTESDIEGDPREACERDADRFLLLAERVGEACHAVTHGRERGRARSFFEKPALPG